MYFEKDKALARRFQPVRIEEPTQVVFNMHVVPLGDMQELNPHPIFFKHVNVSGRCCENIVGFA